MKARARAQVEWVEALVDVPRPSLSGATIPPGDAPRFQRALIRIAWPFANVGASLPNLVATVMGNLYELQEFSRLKLLDLDLPVEFAAPYEGPRFCVEGTRHLWSLRAPGAGVRRVALLSHARNHPGATEPRFSLAPSNATRPADTTSEQALQHP